LLSEGDSMLATGGLLGLLLLGAAVGGLVSGMETDRAPSDGDDGPPDENDLRLDGTPGAVLDGDMAEAAPDGSGRLSLALFGEEIFPSDADPAASKTPGDPEGPGDPAGMQTGHLEVVETIALGDGPDLPLVTDFDSATDRLVLDFDGAESESPLIEVDLETSIGNAVIRADGVPVTVVAGADNLTTALIDVVMNGAAPSEDAGDPANVMEGSGDSAQSGTGREGSPILVPGAISLLGADTPTITGFDPDEDVIELFYDPGVVSEPVVSVEADSKGTGADVRLNGEIVLHVTDGEGVGADSVLLRAI